MCPSDKEIKAEDLVVTHVADHSNNTKTFKQIMDEINKNITKKHINTCKI